MSAVAPSLLKGVEEAATKALERGDMEAHYRWAQRYHGLRERIERMEAAPEQVVAAFVPEEPARARFCENTMSDFRFCRRPFLHEGTCCP